MRSRSALAIVALLLLLGTPFLRISFGNPDDRVLPKSASTHQVGDQLRNDFASNFNTAVTMVIPDADGISPPEMERYAADLSRVPDVSLVSAPTATFVGGNKVGPASAPAGIADGSAFLTVRSTTTLFSDASKTQLDRLHAVPEPAGRDVLIAGGAQVNRDSVHAITSRMPLVLAVIGVITFVLLFLLTGSLVLPLKALVLNVLSLSAAFGALVWIFQEGHLNAFGTTPTGTLEANMPVLLFCIAFGISMDYEVFLVARIREYWLESNKTREDNDESVALGLARTGRVVTAAATIMTIAFAALIAAQVSFMRVFGVGLTLAVLVDATLVRMALLPAFMHVMGRWNWWAPTPLVRLAPAHRAQRGTAGRWPPPSRSTAAANVEGVTAQTFDHPFFARFWTVMSAHESGVMKKLRKENLAGLTGRVLEVGAGTGTNFAFYPDTVTEVVALEPETRLAPHAKQAAASAPVPVTVIESTIETMPAAEPFDAVVCSLVLCSVEDPDGVLRQLNSVLKPGGELRYFEHIASRAGAADCSGWPTRRSGRGWPATATPTGKPSGRSPARASPSRPRVMRRRFPAWVPLPVQEVALGRAHRA